MIHEEGHLGFVRPKTPTEIRIGSKGLVPGIYAMRQSEILDRADGAGEPAHTVAERQARVAQRNHLVSDPHLLAAIVLGAAALVGGVILILMLTGVFK